MKTFIYPEKRRIKKTSWTNLDDSDSVEDLDLPSYTQKQVQNTDNVAVPLVELDFSIHKEKRQDHEV